METLAVKYRPRTFEDVTGQGYTVDILRHQLQNDKVKQGYLFSGASGCGKALENSMRVLAENGWIAIGKLKVGDKVYGSDGNLHNILGGYPQKGQRVGYKVHFTDGTEIIADAEHLWTGHYTFNDKAEEVTVTTQSLYDYYSVTDFKVKRSQRFRIRRASAIDYPYRELSFPPRLYGFFLVNLRRYFGKMGIILTSGRNRELILDMLESYGIRFKEGKRICAFGRRGEFLCEIINDKFEYYARFCKQVKDFEDLRGVIPKYYLNAGIEARIEFLIGVLYLAYDRGTLFQINTNNDNFAESFKVLGNSLGCNTLVHSYSRNGRAFFRIQLVTSSEIRERINKVLPNRRLGRMKNRRVGVSIDKITKADVGLKYTCIETDAPDHLYVIENFLLTHNTTVARIFAHELGENTELLEVDAASNSGVENARELIKASGFKSLVGGKKVFIIDEAHSGSNAFWQAFLKTLEEPPEDVVFIFCTTEPHKVPKTIQNRLMRFNFTRMEIEQIVNRLQFIIQSEQKSGLKLNYEDEALRYIAKISHGGMRDAIANMEKCINADLDLTVANVCEVLSLTSYDVLFALVSAFLKNDNQVILDRIQAIYEAGGDLKQFVSQFMLFVLDLIKFYYTENIDLTEIPSFMQTAYEDLKLNDDTVIYLREFLGRLMELNARLVYESNSKPYIEMLFLNIKSNCSGKN